MPDKIKLADERLDVIDSKLFIANIPIIVTLLIALGLGVDSISRMLESFKEDDARRQKSADASNFYTDLNSFSASANAAGFMIALENELSAVVSFEPKFSELRESMNTLFHDFNANISDWDETRIPNVETFKIRISALTWDLDAVADENLMDVLRIVKDEIDDFRERTEAWARQLTTVQFDQYHSLYPIMQVLAGLALVLGSMLAVSKRKNGLVQTRYQILATKVEAIKEEISLAGDPESLNSLENVKLAILKLLIGMMDPSNACANVVALKKYEFIRHINAVYELPATSIELYLGVIMHLLESLYDYNLRLNVYYDGGTGVALRNAIAEFKRIVRKSKSLSPPDAAAGNGVAPSKSMPRIDHQAHSQRTRVQHEDPQPLSEVEPTMLRIVTNPVATSVRLVLFRSERRFRGDDAIAFHNSISDQLTNFTKAVNENNPTKAKRALERMISSVNRLQNENPEIAKQILIHEGRNILEDLRSCLDSITQECKEA